MRYVIDFTGAHGPRYVVYDFDTGHRITPEGFPTSKQTAYFDALEPFVLFGGARGGGKTEGIIWDHIFTGYLVPGSISYIFRKTLTELSDTVISRFKELPEGLVGRCHDNPLNRHMLVPNGSQIRFRSAKDKKAVRKTLGGESIKTSFDEWAEWEYSDWKFVTGSVRNVRSTDIYGRAFVAQVKGATQPGGDGSDALNHLFGGDIPKSPAIGMPASDYDPSEYRFIQSLVDDNPAYAADTPAGKAYRRMLQTQPPNRRDAWLHGKWTGFEGQYFDCYRKEQVAIPHTEVIQGMHKQKHQPIWISLDYGKVHHSYVSWHTFLHAQLDSGAEAKIPVTFRELLLNELGEGALAHEICDKTPREEIPRIANIYRSPELGSGSLSRSSKLDDVFTIHGLPRSVAAYNEREDGWSVMYGILAQRHKLLNGWETDDEAIIDRCAGWLIDETCPYALEAIPWATADPDHDGDIKKGGDSPMLDILDGLRYGIASYIRPEEQKPYAERVKDEINALPVVGSSRYIRWLKMQKEAKHETEPFYTGLKTTFGERFRRRR